MADRLIPALSVLRPDTTILAVAVALDIAIGDPVYSWHPVRLIGRALSAVERMLRRAGVDGYAGGVLLFIVLSMLGMFALWLVLQIAAALSTVAVWLVHLFVVYSLLALGDLLHHVWRIESAVRRDDLTAARLAVSALVGRDTDRLDAGGCRRAGVESLSESLTDGFISPLFWYVALGLPGLLVFKIVSTMDSMVGYKTERYLRFGWCGARLDDLMNYVPARVSWLLVALVGWVMPDCSGAKAWTVGLTQHAILPGPNAGWSEAAVAGALERRLVGPIWLRGTQVTDVWIGESSDPPLESGLDVIRALRLVVVVGLVATALACTVLFK